MFYKKSAMRLSIICCFCVWGATLIIPTVLHAHGALIEYATATAFRIQASYDTGHPMSGAQIAVFAPNDPITPWLTGTADDQGHFSIVPPSGQTGTLSVLVRLAGHGAMIHIPLTPAVDVANLDQPATASTGYSTLQRLLMAASVVWGCIGTALYFMRRRSN